MSLKRRIVLFIGIAMAFSLAACGFAQQAESNTTAGSEVVQESSVGPGMTERSTDSTSEPKNPEILNKTSVPKICG